METAVYAAIQERLVNGQLPCGKAMTIAAELGLSPAEVGAAANEADIRISHCQLGLFGYGPKAEGKHKIVEPLADVPGELAERIRAAATPAGITCADLWQIAADLQVKRMEASGAVETLGLRVSHCQLGCFPRPK